MIICYDYPIENRDVVGWFEVELWVVRGFLWSVVMWGGSLGCELTTIVWITRPCVAYVEIDWLWSVWMCYMQTTYLLCHQVSCCEWRCVWKM